MAMGAVVGGAECWARDLVVESPVFGPPACHQLGRPTSVEPVNCGFVSSSPFRCSSSDRHPLPRLGGPDVAWLHAVRIGRARAPALCSARSARLTE